MAEYNISLSLRLLQKYKRRDFFYMGHYLNNVRYERVFKGLDVFLQVFLK